MILPIVDLFLIKSYKMKLEALHDWFVGDLFSDARGAVYRSRVVN